MLAARIGIALLLVSMALYLVVLIPSPNARRISSPSRGKPEILLPETFNIHYTSTPEMLNPQTGIQITANTNGTLNFKIFNMGYYQITNWLVQQHAYPGQNWTSQILDEFTTTYSDNLTEDFNVPSGKFFIEIVPPRIENATVIVSNPTSAVVSWTYETKTVNILAPRERVFLSLMITAPLGVALAVPWVAIKLVEKRKTKKLTAPRV